MIHPRLSLVIGICCIALFPVLVKWTVVPEITSAFFRLAIAAVLFTALHLIKHNFKSIGLTNWYLVVLCGILFAVDIAVWNKAIALSSATQASLLTNLAPVWVGFGALLFLPQKPTRNFWFGVTVALMGLVVFLGIDNFTNGTFSLNAGFGLGVLSSVVYACYMVLSKKALSMNQVVPFMMVSMWAAALFLFFLGIAFDTPFSGFDSKTWFSLALQGVICQFAGWLSISYSLSKMRANRVSLALLGSVVVTALLAYLILSEGVTWDMLIGGVIMLAGIGLTFSPEKSVSELAEP
jgi:drug/metabolite transporter (DMT)-like permease